MTGCPARRATAGMLRGRRAGISWRMGTGLSRRTALSRSAAVWLMLMMIFGGLRPHDAERRGQRQSQEEDSQPCATGDCAAARCEEQERRAEEAQEQGRGGMAD